MKISIIIPTWNRRENILNTLTCLARQTIQPQHSFEVIVVDHESTDNTIEGILNSPKLPFPLKLIRIPRKTWDAATPRNYGAKISDPESECLLFLDSDVLLPPNRIQMIIDDYLVDPDPNRVILGPYNIMKKPLNIANLDWWKEGITDYEADLRTKSFEEHHVSEKNQGFGFALACFGGLFLIPRALFFKSGGYDESMVNGGEDGDFGLTLWECGAIVSMDKELLSWHHPHPIEEVRLSTPWETVHRIDAKHNVDVIKETDKNFREWGIPWIMPQLEDAPKPNKRIGEL